MFGCVVAGRLLQTNLQQVDETHAIFELPSASSINHICVFLLGTVPFPDGYGATVHFNWPGKGFQLLGMLSNEKPSAIFRLRGTFTAQSSLAHAAFQTGPTPLNPGSNDVTAILGISIEPFESIQAQLSSALSLVPASANSTQISANDASALAEKIGKHLFTYLSSFADGGGSLGPQGFIQISAVKRWYDSFTSKLRAGGTGFLDRAD